MCAHTVGLRVPLEVEIAGIDIHEHGGEASTLDVVWTLDDILSRRAPRKALMEYMKGQLNEENLMFLLDCRIFFDQLDIDIRIDSLSEERDALPGYTDCKPITWEHLCVMMDNYLIANCPKQINISSFLSEKINASFLNTASLSPRGKNNENVHRSISGSIKKLYSMSTEVAPIAPMAPLGTGTSSGLPKPISPNVMHASEERNAGQCETYSIHGSLDATAETSAGRMVSKEFLQSFLDAYREVHRLVFQNAYGKFCQTPTYMKVRARELMKWHNTR
jgi:hypothetical protein